MKNYENVRFYGKIYAMKFIWGYSTLYNGTVLMLGGQNSISRMIASNDIIDGPIKIYSSVDVSIMV